MLSKLVIKNIALIEELEISLCEGLSVLSGETGAGKSIIIDSVNLVLGERADRELIRTGSSGAVVEAWFENTGGIADDILANQQIEIWPELVLSRELSVSGKNICRVNGTLTTLSVLKSISDRLVDIHGQHEHQSLLSERFHLGMLDGFDPRIAEQKLHVETAYNAYSQALKRRRALLGNDGDRERRIDILKFQIDEILKANIENGEEEELNLQKARLNAAERIMQALIVSYAALYEAEPSNVLSALKDVNRRLSLLSDVDANYSEMAQRVEEAYYTIEEVALAIRGEMEDDAFDAGKLEQVEERLALIGSLKRKYTDPTITGTYISQAESELSDLLSSETLLKELTEKEILLKSDLFEKSLALSEMRRETAKVFAQKVMEQLVDLGMISAQFSVVFAETGDIDTCSFTKNGIDTVEFYISANAGEPQKPLRKVASGGEVSRIMLALKNIVADRGGIPTMIFDEIDTGISGRIAQVVAEKLQNISRGRQVICVTHLPQIASMADMHFLVEKNSDGQTTRTLLSPLEPKARISEVARLAGGDSAISYAHAEEMIQKANIFKATI